MNPFRLTSRVVAPATRYAPAAQMRAEHRVQAASVAVPWQVIHRSPSGVIEVEHCGRTPLRAVRFSLAGRGMLGLTLPRTVHPGERLRVVLRGVYAEGVLVEPDAMLVMRWFQSDGTELLWSIAL